MNSCPQCNAEVPSDNAFCGKCGYAMRDQAPHHLDRSRIRVHEGPPSEPPSPAKARPRQKTVLGIPPAGQGVLPEGQPAEQQPPSRPKSPRVPQKTMLGLPQLEAQESPLPPEIQATQELNIEDLAFQLPAPPSPSTPVERPPQAAPAPPPPSTPVEKPVHAVPTPPPPPLAEGPAYPGVDENRDSLSLPPPLAARRRWVFVACGVLLVLSTGWLIYRFLAGPVASA